MDMQQRLLTGFLLAASAGASAHQPWHLFHHHSKAAPAPAVHTGPPVSAVPIVRRDYGHTETDAMDSSNHLAPTTDALIQSEEELDRLRLEHDDLLSRIQNLQAQLRDTQQLIKLKHKQVQELETQLQAIHGH